MEVSTLLPSDDYKGETELMIPQTKQPATPRLCEHCTSVLSNFKKGKCANCTFVTSYINQFGTVFSVAEQNDHKFRTVYQRADESRPKPYSKLLPQFSYVEAQSQLNHWAAARRWKPNRAARVIP